MRWPIGLFAAISLVLCAAPGAVAGPLGLARANTEIFAGGSRDPYVLAVRAYVWGYPLVRAAQLRQNATRPDDPYAKRPPTVTTSPSRTTRKAEPSSLWRGPVPRRTATGAAFRQRRY